MKKILLLGLLLIKAICASAYGNTFDTLVVFGDSLSDNGNLYRYFLHFIPLSPPYYEGRFTNGPLWVEYVYQNFFPASYTVGFQDYAVGGAGAVLSQKENLPFTLTAELNDYLYWNTYDHHDTSLYLIWIGANNYVNGPQDVEGLTTRVTDAITQVIEQLVQHGANKFLIVNLPDLAKLPQAKLLPDPELLTRLSQAHNRKLAEQIHKLITEHPDALFLTFDAYQFFDDAIKHADDYGITNITDPCYAGSYSGWLRNMTVDDDALFKFLQQESASFNKQQWQVIKNNPQIKEAVETAYWYSLLPPTIKNEPLACDNYLFWDKVHPTTIVHRLIAEEVDKVIAAAGLTATWPQT